MEYDLIRKYEKWAEDMLKEFGYYIHFISGYGLYGNIVNYHTHGLMENLNHKELQIVLPISEKVSYNIFHSIVKVIKSGKKLEDGEMLEEIIVNFPIKIVKTTDGNNEVFRIVFPDPNGLFPEDSECTFPYSIQEGIYNFEEFEKENSELNTKSDIVH